MASSINLRMVATGVTCPKTCLPIPPSIGTCIQWRSAGVIEQLMNAIQEQVREQVKKSPSGQR